MTLFRLTCSTCRKGVSVEWDWNVRRWPRCPDCKRSLRRSLSYRQLRKARAKTGKMKKQESRRAAAEFASGARTPRKKKTRRPFEIAATCKRCPWRDKTVWDGDLEHLPVCVVCGGDVFAKSVAKRLQALKREARHKERRRKNRAKARRQKANRKANRIARKQFKLFDVPRPRDYQAYLLSRSWKRRRAAKLAQVGHKCESCGREDSLQVHHLHYGNVGRESLADLKVLCSDCHASTHGIDTIGREHLDAITRIPFDSPVPLLLD